MESPEGNFVIAYNGELYNFRELKKELEGRGERFATHSDTEVLLRYLMVHGVEGMIRFNGMFAFALWDKKNRRLLLARDRLGIKPLYLWRHGANIAFASEIKALLPLMPAVAPDHAAIFQFLTFQNILTDETFFKGIYKLLPGGWMIWEPGRPLRHGRYWDMEFTNSFTGGFQDAVEEYSACFERAVNRHMTADVPVGAYLSGGIDSAAVATGAARHAAGPLHTFTGAFTDAPYFDERVGSRAVAQQLSAIVHEVEITAQDFADNIDSVIHHLDEPTLGTGALPQYIVSRLVSRHVKVVLTGHGGDELFAGYQVNKAALILEKARANPLSVLLFPFFVRPDEISRVLYYLLFPLIQPEVRHGLFIMIPKQRRERYFTPDFLLSQAGYEPLDHIPQILEGKSLSYSQKLMFLYLRTYLPTLFIQEDKVGMAHSIEARMPICDNELIDLAASLPSALKLCGAALKAIPKAAMRGRLPDILYRLPKRGFPTPFARWFRNEPLKSWLAEMLLGRRTSQRGILNPGGVRSLFERHTKTTTDSLMDYARANTLYSLAISELWHRRFVDSPGA